jgi:hypothetical protein
VPELGVVPPHVAEALVNHTSGFRAGVAGVYNRATYSPGAGVAAMQAWADRLVVAGATEGLIGKLG